MGIEPCGVEKMAETMGFIGAERGTQRSTQRSTQSPFGLAETLVIVRDLQMGSHAYVNLKMREGVWYSRAQGDSFFLKFNGCAQLPLAVARV